MPTEEKRMLTMMLCWGSSVDRVGDVESIAIWNLPKQALSAMSTSPLSQEAGFDLVDLKAFRIPSTSLSRG